MKSMTIHGIDKQLAAMLKAKAEAEGSSINKTIKQLLETALGIKQPALPKNLGDFEEFCGVWSEADVKRFEEKTSDTRIDPEEWR